MIKNEVVPHGHHPAACQRSLGEQHRGGVVVVEGKAEDAPVHVSDIELMVRGRIAVECQAEEAHVGVRHGGDICRGDEVAAVVVGKHALAN